RIEVDLVFNDCAASRAMNLPTALMKFADVKSLPCPIFGANPIHVLGEIADLIQRVPDWKLKLAICGPGRKCDLNFSQMLFGRQQRNRVGDVRGAGIEPTAAE